MNELENDGKKWSWKETLMAFDLYSRIPFSKIAGNNDDVIGYFNQYFTWFMLCVGHVVSV